MTSIGDVGSSGCLGKVVGAMEFKWNEAGLRQLRDEIGRKIADADRRFRAQHEGKPVGEVQPRVKRWFAAIGVDLPANQIADYARAVSAREPFKWVVK
ncbi:hypothetical protein [Streptomyces sp. AC495_CC817]|uniref:hypothetical protein n=1 Tax=Streptomyces sp. AC495_CC817 TaxID=2823900 RepID=UPI001C251EBF|nr:hypothetical protein [Streptomyces sp. AC495_CC817]